MSNPSERERPRATSKSESAAPRYFWVGMAVFLIVIVFLGFGSTYGRQLVMGEEVIEQVLRGMENVHPRIREHVEGAVVKTWSRAPYSLGAYSWPAPGDVTGRLGALQAPHGRIHFAGEHTSVLRSTMEGALRSGIRAATEVNEAAGR